MKSILELFRIFAGDDYSMARKRVHMEGSIITEEKEYYIPHIKLIRGVVIVSIDNAEKVILFLKEFNAEFYVRDVILLPEDEDSLRPSHT